jgi:hypothetical protein
MEGPSRLPEGSRVRDAPTFARAALAFVTGGAPAPVAEARTAASPIKPNRRRVVELTYAPANSRAGLRTLAGDEAKQEEM